MNSDLFRAVSFATLSALCEKGRLCWCYENIEIANMKNKVSKIVECIFKSILSSSFGYQRTFRALITVEIEENEPKPLLILGNAHSKFDDGHCIAILNPDEEILNKVQAGCAYLGGLLKKIIQGKCDLMVEMWINANDKDGGTVFNSYKSKTSKPAKFKVV